MNDSSVTRSADAVVGTAEVEWGQGFGGRLARQRQAAPRAARVAAVRGQGEKKIPGLPRPPSLGGKASGARLGGGFVVGHFWGKVPDYETAQGRELGERVKG